MGRNKEKHSVWAQEVQYEEMETYAESPKDLLNEAYDALNRFHQKEQKRSQHSKRRRHCWQ